MGAPPVWSGLGPTQATDRAGVICAQNLATSGEAACARVVVMGGRCSTGSPSVRLPGGLRHPRDLSHPVPRRRAVLVGVIGDE